MPSVTCSIRSIKSGAASTSIAARGGCTSHGRAAATNWTYSYVEYDANDSACGSGPTRGAGSHFQIRGPDSVLHLGDLYRLSVTFKLAAKGASPVIRTKVFTPGGKNRLCSTPAEVTVPSPATLCTGVFAPSTLPPFYPDVPSTPCGSPSSPNACAFTGPITMSHGLVSMGSVACPTRNCAIRPIKGTPRRAYLGYDHAAVEIGCTHNIQASIVIGGVQLVTPSGRTCGGLDGYYIPIDAFGARSFRVPASWGGAFSVAWSINTHDRNLQPPDSGYRIGGDWESATFNLGGSSDGCAELMGAGSLISNPVDGLAGLVGSQIATHLRCCGAGQRTASAGWRPSPPGR